MKKHKNSVQELIGIKSFTNYGLTTKDSELIFYQVSPTNISVLSRKNIEIKIRHLMMVLSALPNIEVSCTDASECFDDNTVYLKSRTIEEHNVDVHSLIDKDIEFLDKIEVEMASARQFLFVCRCKSMKPEKVFQKANRVEKIITEQGFEVRRLGKSDIKRFLAIYFEASVMGEQMPDADGLQFTDYTKI